jgi:hypothetical protein
MSEMPASRSQRKHLHFDALVQLARQRFDRVPDQRRSPGRTEANGGKRLARLARQKGRQASAEGARRCTSVRDVQRMLTGPAGPGRQRGEVCDVHCPCRWPARRSSRCTPAQAFAGLTPPPRMQRICLPRQRRDQAGRRAASIRGTAMVADMAEWTGRCLPASRGGHRPAGTLSWSWPATWPRGRLPGLPPDSTAGAAGTLAQARQGRPSRVGA